MTQPPHDEPTAAGPAELREQVEHTREELGQTVQALAAKTDVKARAQEKAAEAKEQAAAKAGELKEQATVKAGELKAKAAEQARAKTAQAGQLWEEKTPDPVRQKTAQGAQLARHNRKVLLAAAGVAAVVWLACRRRKG
ncbi:DUF3618 domain-containing protein [Streptomyces sp. NPDC047085]|uniref:DUF3618 domain-containing protein n=1 Tax=Streptomyces sp. NPDC047085 TaxID=3155140 RepID=UPI0033E1E25A